MDAHARSLLERLNTSSSPKPLKLSTPETKTIATPVPVDIKVSSSNGHDTPNSPQNQRLTHATLDRSRETSVAPNSNSTEDTHPTESGPADTVVRYSSSRLHPLAAKDDGNIAIHTSDGDSSVNPEEMPTTPCGSNNSSTVSNGAEKQPHSPGIVHRSPPQGRRIVNDVPSVVTLFPMKPDLPRLQITTDSSECTFAGEGIGQIANIARTFGLYDRDIIGATTKYIVYALKGIASDFNTENRWTHSYHRSKYRN
jgi:hypothetical protein